MAGKKKAPKSAKVQAMAAKPFGGVKKPAKPSMPMGKGKSC